MGQSSAGCCVPLAVVLALTSSCAPERVLTLGRAPQEAGSPDAAVNSGFEFSSPQLVEELYSATKDDNPTLTWDMKEIYYSSKREGDDTDLWWARRDNTDLPFSAPELLTEFSTEEFDTSPAVDGDGLTMWFGGSVEGGLGGLDILRAGRASRSEPWGAASIVSELSTEVDDIPRPMGANGLVMPLGSRRENDTYLTYAATRPSPDASFGAPVLIAELTQEGLSTADAFLTTDGLTILYSHSDEDEKGDLFAATRARLDEPFANLQSLSSLNTDADERDPWLSPDGLTLFFSSDRDGELAIYRASRR